jgi:hypothetical protein
LQQKSGASPTLTVPPVPKVEIPARVANAFPEFKSWWDKQHSALDDWRRSINVVVTGKVAPLET